MEVIDLGHVDLDKQIPDDAKTILTAYQERNRKDIHLVATSEFDAKTWGEYLAQFAWMLSSAFNNQPKAIAEICAVFNNKVRGLRKISKN